MVVHSSRFCPLTNRLQLSRISATVVVWCCLLVQKKLGESMAAGKEKSASWGRELRAAPRAGQYAFLPSFVSCGVPLVIPPPRRLPAFLIAKVSDRNRCKSMKTQTILFSNRQNFKALD